MQRKLSEIAEIPKILSSTLATVSQTFEMLKPTDLQQQQLLLQCQQHRKHSYDEDALDYDLSGATAEQRLKLKAKGKSTVKTALGGGVKLPHLAKDSTPESDYASEGNYESNEADTDDDYGDGDGDDDGENENSKRSSDASEASDEELEEGDNYPFRLEGIDISDDEGAEAAHYSYEYVTRLRPTQSSQQQQLRRKQQCQHQQYCPDNANASADVGAGVGLGVGGALSVSVRQDEAKDYDEDDDDDDDSDEDVVTARLLAGGCESADDTDEAGGDEGGRNSGHNDEDDEDNDDDFLTTTYTWNLSKIPKLQLNDDKQSLDDNNSVKNQIDMDDTDEEKPNKKARLCQVDDDMQRDKHAQWAEDEGEEEKKFTEKLERFWPWADREKIIYKQSTCHLVRRRPLGLVEQRIKLLAKQNLSDCLERQLHSK